ncbi:hypothetical protein ACFLY2_02210 [Patescibacteria group bacterium]
MAQESFRSENGIVVVTRCCVEKVYLENNRLFLPLVVIDRDSREYFKFVYEDKTFYLQKYAGLQELDIIEIVTKIEDLETIKIMDIMGYIIRPSDINISRKSNIDTQSIQLEFIKSEKVEVIGLINTKPCYELQDKSNRFYLVNMDSVDISPNEKFKISGWINPEEGFPLLTTDYIHFTEKMKEFNSSFNVIMYAGMGNIDIPIIINGKKHIKVEYVKSNFPIFDGLKLENVRLDIKHLFSKKFEKMPYLKTKLVTEKDNLSKSDQKIFEIIKFKNRFFFFFIICGIISLLSFILTILGLFLPFTYLSVVMVILITILFGSLFLYYKKNNPNIVKLDDLNFDG